MSFFRMEFRSGKPQVPTAWREPGLEGHTFLYLSLGSLCGSPPVINFRSSAHSSAKAKYFKLDTGAMNTAQCAGVLFVCCVLLSPLFCSVVQSHSFNAPIPDFFFKLKSSKIFLLCSLYPWHVRYNITSSWRPKALMLNKSFETCYHLSIMSLINLPT